MNETCGVTSLSFTLVSSCSHQWRSCEDGDAVASADLLIWWTNQRLVSLLCFLSAVIKESNTLIPRSAQQCWMTPWCPLGCLWWRKKTSPQWKSAAYSLQLYLGWDSDPSPHFRPVMFRTKYFAFKNEMGIKILSVQMACLQEKVTTIK